MLISEFATSICVGPVCNYEVRIHITGPCGRCVMTTLAQEALPQDREILRTAVQQHQGQVGVYAAVVQGGTMRRGDRVRLDN